MTVLALGSIHACHADRSEVLSPNSTPPKAETPRPVTAPAPKPELGSFGVDLGHRDPSVIPANDFYRYVNGHWLDTYQLKPDEKRYGSFIKLHYRAEDQVKAILEELSQRKPPVGSIERKIADYYRSFMDLEALNAKGIDAIKDQLASIDAIKDTMGLIEAFARAEIDGTNAPIATSVEIDRTNPNRYMLNIIHAGLGLPDRSFYLEESFEKVRKAYQENVATMLGFTGLGSAKSAAAAAAVTQLESEIAKHHWPRAELRDSDKTNNVQTLKQLETRVPGYPWRKHLAAARIDLAGLQEVNVYTPSALAPLAKLLTRTPVSTWKHYLTYHLITSHAPLLGSAIDNASFAFHGRVLLGQPQQRDRWKRAIGLVAAHEGLGDAIGKLYVERHFPRESARQMDQLIGNLRTAFKERILALDWMGADTKTRALEKLATFNPKIGAPKKWHDFSTVSIRADDLISNYHSIKSYWYQDQLSRLNRPTDRDEWFMTPQTINAYYNPTFNEIVFPAAILQPPFFDPHADPAVNYGAIGAVIGHEMGHGFDDQGSKYDAMGVQKNWWTDADRETFETRTQMLVEQYNQYEPLEGTKVNGQLTLGENIGDLGGLSVAYHAYKKSLAGKSAPVLEGFTGEQRFFLSWGQVWAVKQRDEYLRTVLKSDPHSPGQFRVNGVVRNMDAWYEAFGVQPASALYLPPDKRVSIW